MKTKVEVQRWCDANGIDLTITRPDVMTPEHHVHADIMSNGKVFRFHGLHNLGLWDGPQAPDWVAIGKDLLEADFGPCEIEHCGYCT